MAPLFVIALLFFRLLLCVAFIWGLLMAARGAWSLASESRTWKKVGERRSEGTPWPTLDQPSSETDPCQPGYTIMLHSPAAGKRRSRVGSR